MASVWPVDLPVDVEKPFGVERMRGSAGNG
jgi:hypothetical protein